MCGIAGFCDFKKNYETKRPYWEDILHQMHKSLAHRGSDQSGIYLDQNTGFSHARLRKE